MIAPSLTPRSSDCQPPISKLSIATRPRKPPIYIMMAMACSERNACQEKIGPAGRGGTVGADAGADSATGAAGVIAGATGAAGVVVSDSAVVDGSPEAANMAAGQTGTAAFSAVGARRAAR